MDDDTRIKAVLYGNQFGDEAAAGKFRMSRAEIAAARRSATPASTPTRRRRSGGRRTEKELRDAANSVGHMVEAGKVDTEIHAVVRIGREMLARIRAGRERRLDPELAQRLRDNAGVGAPVRAPAQAEIKRLQIVVAEQRKAMAHMRSVIADLYLQASGCDADVDLDEAG